MEEIRQDGETEPLDGVREGLSGEVTLDELPRQDLEEACSGQEEQAVQRPWGSTGVACLRSTGEAPGVEVTEGRRWEDRSGVGRARAGGVNLTLSTVRSLAHGECPEGGTPRLPPPWEGWAWREWEPSPLGVGTIGSQSCRQECGLLHFCLNLFPWVQTPWIREPVIKLAVPCGTCLYPQTGLPAPSALRSALASEKGVGGQDW